MKIKKMLLMLGLFGFAGASSYAMAQSYVFRYLIHGVKASSNVGSEEGSGSGNETGPETPENNITSPSDFYFSENNEQLSGNTGSSGSVTVYDELGNSLGSGSSNETGDFTITFNPSLDAGEKLTVEVTDGTDTLTSTVVVPELETDVACYKPANVGKVGTYQGCEGMLIVDRTMLDTAIANGSYAISVGGTSYTFTDSQHNVFTGQVTDMHSLFSRKEHFNEDIGYWDTSNVEDMHHMFRNARKFNQDIGDWDVSNVTSMNQMFSETDEFNQDIGNWNTSKVDDMLGMFQGAKSFNKYIGEWDTSRVTDMRSMFRDSIFNQDISRWDVSNVTQMSQVFMENTVFNQDISSWDVSNVENASNMFNRARSFNQDLSSWCLGEKPMYIENFDRYANSWVLPRPRWECR